MILLPKLIKTEDVATFLHTGAKLRSSMPDDVKVSFSSKLNILL